MVNFSKIALQAILSTVVGITIFFLLLSLLGTHKVAFWSLEIFSLLIVSVLNGLFIESKLGGIVISLIVGFLSFIFFFFCLMLFSSFARVLLNLFIYGELSSIDSWSVLLQSFVGSLLISLVIMSIFLCVSLLTIYLRIQSLKGKVSVDEVEERFYSKYEVSAEIGSYRSEEERKNFE